MTRNPIWEYYSKNQNDTSKAKCHACQKFYSLGSKIPRKQTTHGLKSHLEKCHKISYKEYSSKVNSRKNELKSPKLHDSVSNISVSSNVQLTQEVQTVWPDDHPSAKRIDKCIMDLIIVDMLPYRIIEGEAFKRLNFEDPAGLYRYKLKSENYFQTTLMPTTYDLVVIQLQKLLKEAEWISLTIDEKKSKTSSFSLISFIGHFICGAIRRTVVLSSTVQDNSNHNVRLIPKLKDIINYWNLSEKVHLGIRDNTTSLIRTMNEAKVPDLCCVSQILKEIVNDLMFTQQVVENLVTKAKKIANSLKQNETNFRLLKNNQNLSDLFYDFIQPDEEHWGNLYKMLLWLTEQKSKINFYIGEQEDVKPFSFDEWELLNGVLRILKPFYEATNEISTENSCVSLIIPILAILVKKLELPEKDDDLWRIKATIRNAIKWHFDTYKKNPSLIAATLLDPRFKEMYLDAAEREYGKKTILDFLHIKNKKDSDLIQNVQNEKPSRLINIFTASQFEYSSNLWDAHDNISFDTLKQTNSTYDQILEHAHRQLMVYLHQPRVTRHTNIYEYWNCSQFPLLEAAARKYLSAPPTNSADNKLINTISETYLSNSKYLNNDKDIPWKMFIDNAEKQLFMAYNIRLLDFNY